MENNNQMSIGLGSFTQFCILKYIKTNNPKESQLFDYIDKNYAIFYPPTGFSMYVFIDNLTKSGFIMKEEGKYALTEDGRRDLNFLEIQEGIKLFEDKFRERLATA